MTLKVEIGLRAKGGRGAWRLRYYFGLIIVTLLLVAMERMQSRDKSIGRGRNIVT